jgi:hypothetical protein
MFSEEPLTSSNLQHLRNVNTTMLPIKYSDLLYKKLLKEGKEYSFVGLRFQKFKFQFMTNSRRKLELLHVFPEIIQFYPF